MLGSSAQNWSTTITPCTNRWCIEGEVVFSRYWTCPQCRRPRCTVAIEGVTDRSIIPREFSETYALNQTIDALVDAAMVGEKDSLYMCGAVINRVDRLRRTEYQHFTPLRLEILVMYVGRELHLQFRVLVKANHKGHRPTASEAKSLMYEY